jgi:hypothetical protein
MANRRRKIDMTQPSPVAPERATEAAFARLRKEYIAGDTGILNIARGTA